MTEGVEERFHGANSIEAGRQSPYWGEHVARYAFALPFTGNKKVLDIACGTGYGLALLKKNASAVVGVDIDFLAAKQARAEWSSNTSVLLGDATGLPFADQSFDVVTSFETLEHLHNRSGFLSELKRIIKGAGTLILSTPNANYTKPVNSKPSNPFHIHEYAPNELREEIERHFLIDQFLGQCLRDDFGIPPFYDAQIRLPKDLATQTRLLGWKLFNKLPVSVREKLSEVLWKKSFYPGENDYCFGQEYVNTAPVLVAVCKG